MDYKGKSMSRIPREKIRFLTTIKGYTGGAALSILSQMTISEEK